MAEPTALQRLMDSPDPSVRYKVRIGVMGDNPTSAGIRALQAEIRESPRVQALLADRHPDGRLRRGHVYSKWQGAHWTLATLADIGYPAGDHSLAPIRDQVQNVWLGTAYTTEFIATTKANSYGKPGVPVMEGRHRRCASQQGNALFAIARLGLADDRSAELAELLLHWQWPDGGWNCDKNPSADTSSFMETLTPLRGLVAYAPLTDDARIGPAIDRAAQVFLSRQLFRRRSDGAVIRREFVELHYPLYWHYDILGGLKVMAEAGKIDDPACVPALDLLESKRLPDGGFPAEKRHYRGVNTPERGGSEVVDWGGATTRVMNPWVTADAMTVLTAAGRPAE
jgi:hypothetical protein